MQINPAEFHFTLRARSCDDRREPGNIFADDTGTNSLVMKTPFRNAKTLIPTTIKLSWACFGARANCKRQKPYPSPISEEAIYRIVPSRLCLFALHNNPISELNSTCQMRLKTKVVKNS
ncbi:hypothetical protein Trydic_g1548 [Trypoxylus dichotomus]